ncbi:MAG: P-II family nitrogen regulator [Pseudomonadales bacterium]|nr:P-II family nitrogen regulator [Pseudomonadales bacterium]
MSFVEIKAYVHRNRIADVVDALYSNGFKNLTVIDVKGMLSALGSEEQRYSVEIGKKVVTEVKLELACTDDQEQRAVDLILQHARTTQRSSGWIYVSHLNSAIEIKGSE